ncbi:MAG: hypothetical protein PVJ43_14745 [Gemmatimonadales bacterium]|jgi:hypothetical protein
MSDTPPSVAGVFRNLLARKSPVERLRMCTMMFGTAKTLAIAGIRRRCGELPEAELREGLFLRFYGSDYSERERHAILESLRNTDSGGDGR